MFKLVPGSLPPNKRAVPRRRPAPANLCGLPDCGWFHPTLASSASSVLAVPCIQRARAIFRIDCRVTTQSSTSAAAGFGKLFDLLGGRVTTYRQAPSCSGFRPSNACLCTRRADCFHTTFLVGVDNHQEENALLVVAGENIQGGKSRSGSKHARKMARATERGKRWAPLVGAAWPATLGGAAKWKRRNGILFATQQHPRSGGLELADSEKLKLGRACGCEKSSVAGRLFLG